MFIADYKGNFFNTDYIYEFYMCQKDQFWPMDFKGEMINTQPYYIAFSLHKDGESRLLCVEYERRRFSGDFEYKAEAYDFLYNIIEKINK